MFILDPSEGTSGAQKIYVSSNRNRIGTYGRIEGGFLVVGGTKIRILQIMNLESREDQATAEVMVRSLSYPYLDAFQVHEKDRCAFQYHGYLPGGKGVDGRYNRGVQNYLKTSRIKLSRQDFKLHSEVRNNFFCYFWYSCEMYSHFRLRPWFLFLQERNPIMVEELDSVVNSWAPVRLIRPITDTLLDRLYDAYEIMWKCPQVNNNWDLFL